ncbi:MAG: hypothetical protein LAO07_12910 [Acidobacteriia bacterium]|nr:hypothetical protein [Terriglobia bacterium]
MPHQGLPVYAECGGLMLLAQGLVWRGQRFSVAGVLPCAVGVCPQPQGTAIQSCRWTDPTRSSPLG